MGKDQEKAQFHPLKVSSTVSQYLMICDLIAVRQEVYNLESSVVVVPPCILLMQLNVLRHRLMLHFTKVGGNGER